MPITLTCTCGKKLRVGDDKAGKKGKCPGCGSVLNIPGAPQAAPKATAPAAKPLPAATRSAPPAKSTPVKPGPAAKTSAAMPTNPTSLFPGPFESAKPTSDVDLSIPMPAAPASDALPFDFADIPIDENPVAVEVAAPAAPAPAIVPSEIPHRPRRTDNRPAANWHIHLPVSWIIAGILAILIPAFLLMLKLGPLRARDEFNAATQHGQDDITSVITLAIQVQMANNDGWDPRHSAYHPGVKGDIQFLDSGIHFSMPDRTGFIGTSSEGGFQGLYDLHTGAIEADVKVPGTTIHVTGQVKDGVVTANINGTPAVMPPPKPDQ